MRRTIKLRYEAPEEAVEKLVKEYNYRVSERVFQQHILLAKIVNEHLTPLPKPVEKASNVVNLYNPPHVPSSSESVTAERKRQLEDQCDKIIDWFPDPYRMYAAVRTRLHNFRQRLPIPEQQFVLEFMDEHFPENTP